MPGDNAAVDEAEFLLAAIRLVGDEQLIRQRAGKIADFDCVTRLACKHGVLPLLYSRLAEFYTGVPQDYLARLRDEYCTNAAQNLAAASELMTLLEDFGRNEIPILPFKGVALAGSVYGDVGLRPAGDLDLLIFRRDLPRASQILISRAYELRTPFKADGTPVDSEETHECKFKRNSDGMIVELRWRLTEPQFRCDWGMDWLWPRKQTSTLLGTQIPALSPEQTLILLCLHGSKHFWSRLIWIRDVAQLLSVRPDLEWGRTIQEAKRLGLSRTLALGILLGTDISGGQVPERILRRARNDKVVSRLAQHFAANLFDDAKRISRAPLYQFQLLEFGDDARWLWNTRAWRPSPRDRAMVRIAPPLDFLYYLIRPLRLVRDYLTNRD